MPCWSELFEGTNLAMRVFDPDETWKYDTYQAFSKSINSPWNKQKLTGRVKTTIVSGKVVYTNGKMV